MVMRFHRCMQASREPVNCYYSINPCHLYKCTQHARMMNSAYLRLFNCHRNYIYTSESIINGGIYAEEESNERETGFLNAL